MRTTVGASARGRANVVNKILAGALAIAATVATTSAVALQDIAALNDTTEIDGPRWLTTLVAVPQGSRHAKAEDRLETNSVGVVSHKVTVKTASAFSIKESAPIKSVQGPIRVSRAMKGPRVFVPTTASFNVEQAGWALLQADTMVTGSVEKNAELTKPAPTNHLMAMAQTFRASTTVIEDAAAEKSGEGLAGAVRTRLAEGQLQQARAAARLMASVVKKVKRADATYAQTGVKSTLSAYAPQERDIASAFAAVLRPAPGKKIRLGRGDHKWAAKPLPAYTRSRNERQCLASGVYFEARSEPLSGQQAVAQVILNRVRNPAYPNTICGVVYQNKWKRNACQFSFACDGIKDRVNSRKHWKIAQKVANDAIEGRFWLRSVGSASHYHADYVWPRWRRSMKKMVKIGRHIFYRTYGGGWS